MLQHSKALEPVFRMTADELLESLQYRYKRAATIAGDGFLFVRGEPSAPCIVSHVDTVHHNLPGRIFFDADAGCLFSPGNGLGADDRAGVYAANLIWDAATVKPSLLFCDGEEIGGTGAASACAAIPAELSAVPFFVELDRKGKEEAVFYSDEGKDFREHILKFGFKETMGTFSDISIISGETRRPSVNLSIGYYNQHTSGEFLIIPEMLETIGKVQAIIAAAVRTRKTWEPLVPRPKVSRFRFPFSWRDRFDYDVEYEGKRSNGGNGSGRGRSTVPLDEFFATYKEYEHCEYCDRPIEPDPQEDADPQAAVLCEDCKIMFPDHYYTEGRWTY